MFGLEMKTWSTVIAWHIQQKQGRDDHIKQISIQPPTYLFRFMRIIIESVDTICRDSTDTQYMLIQTNFSKSQKQLTYKPL